MSDDTTVLETLKQLLDRMARLEAKIDALSIGEFSGTINTQNVTISNGGVTFEAEIETMSVSAGANMVVQFEADVNDVAINSPARVDISGEIASIITQGKADISGAIESLTTC